MLDFLAIETIAGNVARHQVVDAGVERVVTEAVTDSEGNDALRITFVLKPEAAKALTGDAALDLLVELQQELRNKGEERLPIIEYATEQEIELESEEEDESGNEDD